MKPATLLNITVSAVAIILLVSYNVHTTKQVDNTPEIIQLGKEVVQLQKEIIHLQETSKLLLIRMSFVEKWKDSILYRPPEPLLNEGRRKKIGDRK